MEIIPESCLLMLPFSPEPISVWSDRTDLLEFLCRLFDKPGSMMDSTGKVTKFNYSIYGKHLFDSGLESFRSLCADFEKLADESRPAPAAESQAESTPDLSQDDSFGLMAKYAIAWDSVVSEVLSESAFFSLAHVLEAQSDLDCSVLLASNMYYKQAVQVLRNLLEEVVMELHFCSNQNELEAWKVGKYRTPPLRGKDGVVNGLLVSGLISAELADAINGLYGDLNASIHGAETQLIHRGVFQGKWSGPIFKYERFREWCNYLSRSVESGIRVLRITVNLWDKNRPTDRILCDVCHSEDFDIEKSQFAGLSRTTLKCRVCGSSRTYDSAAITKLGY